MKKLLLVAVCALCTMAVSAQRASSSSSSFFSIDKVDGGVRFGIRAGVNFANMSFSNGDYSASPGSRTTFHVGVVADIPLVESFYIQSGLFLQNKGYKVEVDYEDSEYYNKETMIAKPMYLEIPVLASYRYNFNDATQLQINFGPYFGYGIGGKFKSEYEDEGYQESEEEDCFQDGELKRFNCGLQVGAGITFASHIYLGIAYQFGLSNISDDGGDLKVKDKNLMVSVGYTF